MPNVRSRDALALLLPALVLALSGCASKLRGDAHFDETAHFDALKKVAITSEASEGVTDAQRANRALVEQLIRSELGARGYTFVAQQDADLLLSYHGRRHSSARTSGWSGSAPMKATLVIQFEQATDGQVVWYGWADETWWDSMDASVEIRKAVPFVLSKFPPAVH